MNGKIVLCLAVVFVGQAMSAATGSSTLIDTEDFKKVADQITQSFMSITNHVVSLYPNSADAQKSVDKVKTMIAKGFEDVETETNKLKDIVRKNADPKLVEKYDALEKAFKQQVTDAKVMFEDKIGKPINEKVDLKKITETLVKNTKEFEVTMNKAIDGVKKP